jgi:hypothetical protein
MSRLRNMPREFSEELLGNLEHDGTASAPINYEADETFRSLNQARREGRLRVFCLGPRFRPSDRDRLGASPAVQGGLARPARGALPAEAGPGGSPAVHHS